MIKLNGCFYRYNCTLCFILKLHQKLFVLLLSFSFISRLFGAFFIKIFHFLVYTFCLILFVIILSKIIAKVKSNAIEFDVVFIDCLNNLLDLIFRIFGILFSICDQEDSLPVFLGSYKSANHIHSNNQAIKDVTLLLLLLLRLESLDMPKEIQINFSYGAVGSHIFILSFAHLIIQLIWGIFCAE